MTTMVRVLKVKVRTLKSCLESDLKLLKKALLLNINHQSSRKNYYYIFYVCYISDFDVYDFLLGWRKNMITHEKADENTFKFKKI